jgi:triosephosphate isomerase
MNKKIIIGNWKMNPSSLVEAKKIASKSRLEAKKAKKTEIIIAPPFIYTIPCSSKSRLSNFSIGAQSVSRDEKGSHTGEVSAGMLKDSGVDYVIVGHSEERERGDTDEIVFKKSINVIQSGMKAVVCIGEKTRDQENGSHYDFIKQQIKTILENIPKSDIEKIIIAYEPIWAIGAKEAMVPDQICEMVIFIRKVVSDIFDSEIAMKLPILYGGSVNANNSAEIVSAGKVDGLLVGRESLSLENFPQLIRSVDSI